MMIKKLILLAALGAVAGCAVKSLMLEVNDAHTAGMGNSSCVEAAAE